MSSIKTENRCSKYLKDSYQFHPFEISFCGYSGTGKTTLICTLIERMSCNYRIGYLKHDAHTFSMDHPGKDTFKASHAGAHSIYINDDSHTAHLSDSSIHSFSTRASFLDSDLLFIEGWKESTLPKIVFFDKHSGDTQNLLSNDVANVLCYICVQHDSLEEINGKPVFFRDDVDGVQKYIQEYLQHRLFKVPIYGLILIGGKSTRMGQDKSLLEYHGKPQWQNSYELLEACCKKVFISSRPEQLQGIDEVRYPQIHDKHLELGPIGGLLSAMAYEPTAAWFVLACDLPFVTLKSLRKLLKFRDPIKFASGYRNQHDGLFEPVSAIYEPKCRSRIFQALGADIRCLRKIFPQGDLALLSQDGSDYFDNINTPEEYSNACLQLQKKEKKTHA